jgi:hypothetical protein
VACMCIREVFGKHSRNIRRVRKTFGKHTSSSWCIRNGPFTLGRMPFQMFSEYESSGIFETVRISSRMCLPKIFSMYHRMLSVCFPNVFRTSRMFLECFPNTSRIHLQDTFVRSIKIILNMRNTFFELPNAVPYASVRNRTANMLLEYTECFPNTVRSLAEHQH